jgi:hypothetical protein
MHSIKGCAGGCYVTQGVYDFLTAEEKNMEFFKIDIRYNQPTREAQIIRYEILELLLDLIDLNEDPETFRYYLDIWNRDRVWDIRLTDDELESVCDLNFMEDVCAYIDSYAKAHKIKLRQV